MKKTHLIACLSTTEIGPQSQIYKRNLRNLFYNTHLHTKAYFFAGYEILLVNFTVSLKRKTNQDPF